MAPLPTNGHIVTTSRLQQTNLTESDDEKEHAHADSASKNIAPGK